MQCMQPLVSVIVPVYKVEDVLSRCLSSLRRQSLYDIEIVLVDDASPDRCGAICDEYSKNDSRFKVFHNETNMGLSVSRNIGIENATADYLMFVDSDDCVHEDFCKLPYECAVHQNVDLVLFRYQTINKKGKATQIIVPDFACGSGLKTKLEALELILNVINVAAWNKLYRKDLFNTVLYPPGYLYEDVGTTYKFILQSSRIFYLDKVLYYYCYREGSITSLKKRKALNDWITMFMQQYHDLVAWGYPSEKLEKVLQGTALTYCIKKKPDEADPNYAICAHLLQNQKVTMQDMTWKRSALLFLFKYYPTLFEIVCTLYGKKVC